MTSSEIKIEQDFVIYCFLNDTNEVQDCHKPVKMSSIQFHFNLKGGAKFLFNNGSYLLNLEEEKSLLLYNPQKELPLHLQIEPQSWVLSLIISIKKFHALFSSEAEVIPFLSNDNLEKKYYSEEDISPSMAIVLHQIFNNRNNSSIKNLYLKAKCYELLSLYFNTNDDANIEKCPFLLDEQNVLKLKRAKEIMLSNLAEPPSLQELSAAVGLNIKKLKEGFKEIYNNSVYGFLLDYKLEYSRKALDSGVYNVNEIAAMVGYSNSSHFIAAFKKKYGLTPKKYMLNTKSATL